MEVYKILHQNNVIIRELKPEKILIKYNSDDETDFDIKICDYSFSKELSDEDQTKTIIVIFKLICTRNCKRGTIYKQM